MRKYLKHILFLTILTVAVPISRAQFYNGMQMTFGKNRVQYNDFFWQYYRFDKFDTYFNQFGKNLALYTQYVAEKEITRIENQLDYNIDRRIIFLIYNKLTDFRQSNIGLVNGNDDYNTGGMTRIVSNKVFLYFEGDHKKFQQQITQSVAQIVLNEMLYGNELRENVANSTLINIPDWYMQGLLSYYSDSWNVDIENRVKDGILSGKYKKINRLTGDDAIYAGHSFWYFIEKTYGRSVIPNIIYITRVNKSAKQGFLYVLGSSLKDISKEWWNYFQDRYKNDKINPADFGTTLLKRPKKTRVYQRLRISSDGRHIAYVTNEMGQYRLWLYDEQTGRKKCLLKREHKLDQIPDYTFPVMAWHPNGHVLTYISEENGGLKLCHYDIDNKTLTTKNFLYMEKVLDFSYSQDGSHLVMSAMREGRVDIYVHTLASATNEQITDDIADDQTPKFVNSGRKILFSSNRVADTLISGSLDPKGISPYYRLFSIAYPKTGSKLTRITYDDQANHTQPNELSSNKFTYLSDANGIRNSYVANFDSIISLVDTTVHYRYFTRSYPVTNYRTNILDQDVDKKNNKAGRIFFWKNRNQLYQSELLTDSVLSPLKNTSFRNDYLKKIRMEDSTSTVAKKATQTRKATASYQKFVPFAADSAKAKAKRETAVDINNYVFEIEKPEGERLRPIKAPVKTSEKTENDSANNPQNKIRIYQTAFYTNLLVSQVDFTFLNSSYQVFSGGQSYYNPGFNALIKIGTTDLFEDYKVTGGFRIPLDFSSTEYLLSFENLKKRLDKQIVFHRQGYKNTIELTENGSPSYYLIKTVTTDGYFILKYPFSQVFALRGTASVRNDRISFLSTDPVALAKPDIHNYWGGLKLELIFDNTRSLGINIYSGTRFKAFSEAYKQIDMKKSDLFVLGADFRHYEVIHRNLIFATRFAGSASFGHKRIAYFLGAVDNWINLSTKVSTFDNSIPVDPNGHYAYQAQATNMRGFVQNVRNGNNFFVMNNEIRWPFVKYFANYPLSSNFWNSLQIAGFFDAGSAWTGWTPFSGKNAYDKNIIPPNGQAPVVVTLDSNRSPIVYGYGFGFRAQILGYFMRFDWAWGIENNVVLPSVFYFSLNLDF